MSTQACRSNSNSILTEPVSLAPRLNTQPPQPRMAPVRVRTSRDGSSMETAFISIAQGTLIDLAVSRCGTMPSHGSYRREVVDLDRCSGVERPCPPLTQGGTRRRSEVASGIFIGNVRGTDGGGEQSYCLRKRKAAESFAARFAAKEAGAKALGTGISYGVSWLEIEVVRERSGRPTIVFYGRAAQIAAHLGVEIGRAS